MGPSQHRFLAMADEYGVQRYESTHSGLLPLLPPFGAAAACCCCWRGCRNAHRAWGGLLPLPGCCPTSMAPLACCLQSRGAPKSTCKGRRAAPPPSCHPSLSTVRRLRCALPCARPPPCAAEAQQHAGNRAIANPCRPARLQACPFPRKRWRHSPQTSWVGGRAVLLCAALRCAGLGGKGALLLCCDSPRLAVPLPALQPTWRRRRP